MIARRAALTGVLASLLLACPVHALDQPIGAVRLVLSKGGYADKLVFVSKDPGFLFPPVGSADDPATGSPGGALLELFSASEGYTSLAVPPGEGSPGWAVASGPVARFRFRNSSAPAGASPVRVAVLKEGRLLKLVARATGLALVGPQLAIAIRITTGTRRSCALFDAPTIKRDEAGKFVGHGALASSLPDCSDASLNVVPCQLFDGMEPVCGGACPVGRTCVGGFTAQIGLECTCIPEGATPCLGSGYPQCGGTCVEGRQCQAFHLSFPEGGVELSECACVDPGDTCADPAGTCFAVGICPPGQVCLGQGPPTSACGCFAP